MTSFFTGQAAYGRAFVAQTTATLGIPLFRSLVLRYRVFDPDERIAYTQIPCYADYVTPEVGYTFIDSHQISAEDYQVHISNLPDLELSSVVSTGVECLLDARMIAGKAVGGFECEVIAYTQDLTGVTLFLRKKPNQPG